MLCQMQVKLLLAFGMRINAATIWPDTFIKDFHVALQQSQSVMAKFMAKIPIYDPDIGANCLESRGYGAVLVPVLLDCCPASWLDNTSTKTAP